MGELQFGIECSHVGAGSDPPGCARSSPAASIHALRIQTPARSEGAPPVAACPHGNELNCRLQALAYEVTVAEARERQRIAQSLHDDLGQLLAMVQFRLGELGLATADAVQAGRLEDLRQLVCEAARATRLATYELHTPLLRQLGFDAALQSLVQRLRRLAGASIHLEGEVGDLPVPEPILSVVFRVVRELAQNAQRHAQASNVWIRLSRDGDALRVRVIDDGRGFDLAAAPRAFGPEGGFGLFSADAQMRAIGGRLELSSAPGQGTHGTVSLGWAPGAAAAPTPARVQAAAA